jgi:tetratricopeptide (TPR) repeat protein
VFALPPAGLAPPHVAPPVAGAAPRTAGLAFYCAQEGLAWAARMPNGSELPLLLRTPSGEEPRAETSPGVATYYVPDLPGGQPVSLVARLKGAEVWTSSLMLVDGATSLVLCVPEPDVTATQNPEMFAHLFGTLEVTCNEPGSEIYVDNGPIPWGATVEGAPALLYCVVPGVHRVEVRKEFFVPASGEVEVLPGKRGAFNATLTPVHGRIELVANVAGVRAEVVGPDPSPEIVSVALGDAMHPRVLTLPAGAFTVRASAPGFAPWTAQLVLRGDADRRVEIAMHPVACPLCGHPAGTETFTCPSCRREHVHAFHRYDKGVCIDCAARAAFDRARAEGTFDAWRGFLDAFRSANPRLTRQAELEIRRMTDDARERELAERTERFAKLASRNSLGEIIATWRRMVIERPGDADSHLALATELELVGDRQGALAGYRAAAERAPGDPFARRELGRLLAVMRMPADAVREYTAAVTIKPDFADAHFELANLLASTGQLDAAIEGFRMAAASRSRNPVYHEGFGRALAQRGRFREASEAFRQAANGYRRDGNLQRAAAAEQWAQNAINQTALHKAGKFFKELFE